MELSRLATFQILGCCLALVGCHKPITGAYRLDLEQTKQCVEKSAAANPDDASMKGQAITMLEGTTVDLRLEEGGKMTTTTHLGIPGQAPTTQKTDGTWQLDGKRILIKTPGKSDTFCDVDGTRLRCKTDVEYKLFSSYVLVHQ